MHVLQEIKLSLVAGHLGTYVVLDERPQVGDMIAYVKSGRIGVLTTPTRSRNVLKLKRIGDNGGNVYVRHADEIMPHIN